MSLEFRCQNRYSAFNYDLLRDGSQKIGSKVERNTVEYVPRLNNLKKMLVEIEKHTYFAMFRWKIKNCGKKTVF